MHHLNVIRRYRERCNLDVATSQSLHEVLIAGSLGEINALTSSGCCCSGGTYEVYFIESDFARLPDMKPSEIGVLSINEARRTTSRLSCKVKLSDDHDGLTITVAPEL